MTNFPIFEKSKAGFRVKVSDTAYLPGIYLSEYEGERAAKRYYGKSTEMSERKRRKEK